MIIKDIFHGVEEFSRGEFKNFLTHGGRSTIRPLPHRRVPGISPGGHALPIRATKGAPPLPRRVPGATNMGRPAPPLPHRTPKARMAGPAAPRPAPGTAHRNAQNIDHYNRLYGRHFDATQAGRSVGASFHDRSTHLMRTTKPPIPVTTPSRNPADAARHGSRVAKAVVAGGAIGGLGLYATHRRGRAQDPTGYQQSRGPYMY